MEHSGEYEIRINLESDLFGDGIDISKNQP
jgi:hypothetical protein